MMCYRFICFIVSLAVIDIHPFQLRANYSLGVHCNPDTTICPVSQMKGLPVPVDEKIIDKYGWDTVSWSVFEKANVVYAVNTFSKRYQDIEVNYMGAELLPEKIAKSFKRRHKSIVNFGRWIFKVDDGWLIGVNRGEFGAELYWYSNNGKSEYKISDDHVVQFIRKSGRIYALQGLTHLDYSRGSIQELIKENGKWKSILMMVLPEAPEGADIDSKGDLIVGTSNGLYRIDQRAKIDTLVANPFWGRGNYLYPNNLLVKDDIVYYGMRDGVYKYSLLTKNIEWLMKLP